MSLFLLNLYKTHYYLFVVYILIYVPILLYTDISFKDSF